MSKTCSFVQHHVILWLTTQTIFESGYCILTEPDLNINSVCKLSKDRYPDQHHAVGDILHTYSECLQRLDKYSDVQKDTLMKQLLDRLECLKVDMKEQYYAGNVKYEDVEQVSTILTLGFAECSLPTSSLTKMCYLRLSASTRL